MYVTKRIYSHDLNEDYSLVLNALTGAVDLLESSVLADLKAENFSNIPADIIRKLIERGYLFNSQEEESAIIETYVTTCNTALSLSTVYYSLVLSKDCNLKCPYCVQDQGTIRDQGIGQSTMTSEQLFNACQTIKRLRDPNRHSILELYGGEPLQLSNKKLIEQSFEFARDESIGVAIITNSQDLISLSELIKVNSELIEWVQVTVDGPANIHDSRRISYSGDSNFQKVSESITFLLEQGIKVKCRTNVDQGTLPYLSELADIFQKNGWSNHPLFSCEVSPVETALKDYDGPAVDTGLLVAIIERFIAEPQLRSVFRFRANKLLELLCSAILGRSNWGNISGLVPTPLTTWCESNSGRYLAFAPDGLIYACPDIVGIKSASIGSFAPFRGLTLGHGWFPRNITQIPKCSSCIFALLCGGGCAARAFLKNETPRTAHCPGVIEALDTLVTSQKDNLLGQIGGQPA